MTELLAAMNIRDMNLDDRALQRADAVVKRDTRVGIGTGIQHDAVVALIESHLLHLVDEFTFDVALIVVYLHVGIALTQVCQTIIHRL